MKAIGVSNGNTSALLGKMTRALFAWIALKSIKLFKYGPAQKESSASSYRERNAVPVGVSAIEEKKTDREFRRAAADMRFERSGNPGYLKGRPMISDEVTFPQKQQEKDRYEQVLIERIALNPKDIEAYERLGDYYMENENLNDAKECFKQVLRLSPLSRRARIRMRRVEKSLSGR